MAKLLRLNEARVLLALKCSNRPLSIDEIAKATDFDTPNGEGIGTSTVRKALYGVAASEKTHESTGYPGLIARGYVTCVDGRFLLSLPDARPGPGSEETDEEE